MSYARVLVFCLKCSHTNVLSENIKVLCIIGINLLPSAFFFVKRKNPEEDGNSVSPEQKSNLVDHLLENYCRLDYIYNLVELIASAFFIRIFRQFVTEAGDGPVIVKFSQNV